VELNEKGVLCNGIKGCLANCIIVFKTDVYTLKSMTEHRDKKCGKRLLSSTSKAFTDIHAPVMIEAFPVALIIRILMKLSTGTFDIETAFLYSE
jgi:hypothetical protein